MPLINQSFFLVSY